MAGEALDDLPSSFQHQVVSDLERLAGRPGNPSASHANAAMTVSECYIVGYGVNSDMKSVLHWLHQAALAGSTKAAAWYNRLCVTVGSSPLSLDNAATYEDCENRLSDTPVVDYLHARIQQLELARRREAHLIFEGLFLDETFTEQRMVELATFHHLQTDHLSPVHVAAWLGLDSVIKNSLTSPSQVNLVSKLGRTAIFYACLGGNLSTLRFLINAGGNVDHRDFFGIAPLHLCVFFPKCAVEDAVSLLVKHGADPNAVMNSTLEWEEHDITLLGTPMEWAVQCRHSQLIQSLLQTAAEIKGLNTAIELFFWEIVDLLLLQKACNNEELPQLSLSPIDKPYRHWIAHGKDHLQSLSWTLDVLEKHGLDIGRQFAALDNSTLLIATIHRSKTVDDFEIIRQLAKRGQNVKFANENGFTALGFAISMSKQKETWTETLQELLTYYDISELEQNYIYDGSYLHSAVVSDSVIGARELLRKGVNVNQLTYDHFEDTPLQLCVLCDGSPEMMTLLLENGASTERSDGASKLSPLESRVSGLQRTSKLLDLLLERRCSREFCLPALHLALTNALVISDTARRDILEVFRHMIAKPAVQSLVNDTKLGEITLLHRAAASLNLYLTKLLLEAGADVRISTNIEGEDLIPLQVALGNGKFYWEAYASKSQSTTEVHERSRRDAFDTTCLLLSEHTAHKNGAFEGITQLHLAAYMGIAEVVEGLTASPGIDIEAKGSWPGQAGLLTPAQLLAATLVPDACGYPFVKPSSDISEQVQSPSTAPKEYTLRQEETDGRSLPFQDLEDVKTEVRDNYGVNMTLTLSPRLIYNNASRVMRLLGHEFSLTV